ncbi:hypothetical protein HY837_01230, partial [archaeon]|nr:hypothetical protein [archaeon]
MFFTKSRNRKHVLSFIENQDYEAASKLLSAYETEKSLKTKDTVELKLTIERGIKAAELEEKQQKVISDLESALEEKDLDLARKALNQFGQEKIFDREKLQELESKIYDWTEEGLYDRIQTVQGNDKVNLSDWYLHLYPETNHRKEVLRELVFASCSGLLNKFKENRYFDKVIDTIENTNKLLGKYFKNEFVLNDLVPIEELTRSAEEYLRDAKFLNSEGKLSMGAEVKHIYLDNSDKRWNESYFKERENSFPSGSEGKIIGLAGRNVFVKFENTRGHEWRSDWSGLSNYWGVEGKSVAE